MRDNVIPIARWGRDHWSSLAYVETCLVDGSGEPDPHRMRTDLRLHPLMGHSLSPRGTEYPTRLCDGGVAHDHDDWSCLDDAEAEGLLTNVGTGIHRRYRLTPRGQEVVLALRAHKASGGSFATFRPKMTDSVDGPLTPRASPPLVPGAAAIEAGAENR